MAGCENTRLWRSIHFLTVHMYERNGYMQGRFFMGRLLMKDKKQHSWFLCLFLDRAALNPLQSNGLFHPYILEESICYLRGIRCNFLGLFGSREKLLFANSGDPDQMLHHLTRVCTVCLCTRFRVSRQQWVKGKHLLPSARCSFQRSIICDEINVSRTGMSPLELYPLPCHHTKHYTLPRAQCLYD